MELFNPRQLKLKAWNTETKLMMRLNNIDCLKGELHKKDHILLQFTGCQDSRGDDIYDMDVVLIDNTKYIIKWDDQENRWSFHMLEKATDFLYLKKGVSNKMIRLCSYFEIRS